MPRRLIHFCFGMVPDFGERPFGLSHYLSIRSAWEVLRPDAIILHCAYEPSGKWWDLASPMLMIHRVRPIKGIYGFPVCHPAHQADIIRLAALIAMGGTYADTDVLFLKSFDNLPNAPFLAAQESLPDGIPVGLSNAVLIAEADSSFARLCLEGHDPARSLWSGFRSRGRDEHYVEYSVRYPSLLAERCPGMLKVLPSELFLPISWDEASLKCFFEGDEALPPDSLSVHLWESHSWKTYLSQLTTEEILATNTTFNRLARRFLPEIPVTPGGATLPPTHLEIGFDRMDRLCIEVDFVKDVYFTEGSIIGQFKWKLRKFAGQLRSELLLPLRSRTDQLEIQIRNDEWRSGVPHVQRSKENTRAPLCRLGIGDGSDKMLSRALKDLPGDDSVTYLISTGDGKEPAAANWLALSSEGHGTWISASLSRAQTLHEWSIQTGRLCKALHSSALMSDWERAWKAVGVQLHPTVLVLAGTGLEYWQWRAMENCSAKVVLVACNPAISPNSSLVVPSEDIGDESGIRWGCSLSAMKSLGMERGYQLVEVSVDGQFLLFKRNTMSESQSTLSSDILDIKIRTIYGETVETTLDVVKGIFNRTQLLDISKNNLGL